MWGARAELFYRADLNSFLSPMEICFWVLRKFFDRADSNSFLNPMEILPIAQENKY